MISFEKLYLIFIHFLGGVLVFLGSVVAPVLTIMRWDFIDKTAILFVPIVMAIAIMFGTLILLWGNSLRELEFGR